MKSKLVLYAAVFVIISAFTGCGTVVQEGNVQKTNGVQMQEKEKNISKENEKIGYEIIRKVSEDKDNNTKIFYPKISGYKGELLMDYMNQSLKRVVNMYEDKETYKDINIDYRITKMDGSILSVLYKGTGKLTSGKEITIQQSVNLDIKTSNVIEYSNLIKNDQTSGDKVRALLNQKAKVMGEFGVEFERVRLYFEGNDVVFYYMPADDSTIHFVEISVPTKELEDLINTDFGKRPVS